jgi:hypothetical protein
VSESARIRGASLRASARDEGSRDENLVVIELHIVRRLIVEVEAAKRGQLSRAHANVVDATVDRVLTQMEATLEITQRTSAAWVVYEEVGSQYELRVDQATKLDPGVPIFGSQFAMRLFTSAPELLRPSLGAHTAWGRSASSSPRYLTCRKAPP